MDSELMELEDEEAPSTVTSKSVDWLAQLSSTTPTVPPTSTGGGNENELVLVPTMSSGFELLAENEQGAISTDTLGWSLNLTTDPNSQFHPTVSEPTPLVAMETKNHPTVSEPAPLVSTETKDTEAVSSNISETFVFNINSFDTNKITAAVNKTDNVSKESAQSLLTKLPQLYYMTADVILTT